MNSDLISRKNAIEALHKLCLAEGLIDEFDTEDTLRKLPSAEPERKRGKWVVKEEDWRKQQCWNECSECGFATSHQYNFCPHCGADMMTDE